MQLPSQKFHELFVLPLLPSCYIRCMVLQFKGHVRCTFIKLSDFFVAVFVFHFITSPPHPHTKIKIHLIKGNITFELFEDLHIFITN